MKVKVEFAERMCLGHLNEAKDEGRFKSTIHAEEASLSDVTM